MEVDDELIYDTMIILGYEMPHTVVHNYPEPKHDTAAYYGYSHCARYVHDVADFIRAKGYDCRARSWEGFIKYSVHAVNAGMGNFSTYGICHTPEAGTRLKYCSVIIDAELLWINLRILILKNFVQDAVCVKNRVPLELFQKKKCGIEEPLNEQPTI